jgi:acetyl-CoA carboxylase biotin carboxyl carrier protein
MDLTSEDVQDILRLLDGLPFGELHLQTARFSLHLRRAADGEWAQELQVLTEPTMTPAASPEDEVAGVSEVGRAGGMAGAGGVAGGAVGAGGVASGETGGAVPAEPDGLRAVLAPLPGTFYRAPMPGAPPFVEVGSHVEPDTVVGIVETMKLMNSVPAGVSGTVEQIPVANAQFAERGTVLIWIREDH